MAIYNPATASKIDPEEAKRLAHEALDRWLSELETSWTVILCGGTREEVAAASTGRPDLPMGVHKAVDAYVEALVHKLAPDGAPESSLEN